jgi:hypothetical protein
VVLGAVLLCGGPALALQFPSAGSKPSTFGKAVFPDAGVRGQELTVNLSGAPVSSSTSCSFGAGITVVSCGRGRNGQIVAKLRISPNATLGYRTVVIKEPGGKTKSLPRSFRVVLAQGSGGKGSSAGGGGLGGAGGSALGGTTVNGGGWLTGGGSDDGGGGSTTAAQWSAGAPSTAGAGGTGGGPGGPPTGGTPPPPGLDGIGPGLTDPIYEGLPGGYDHPHAYTWLPNPPGPGDPEWNAPPTDLEYAWPDAWTFSETTILVSQETPPSAVPGPGGLVMVGLGGVVLISVAGQRRRPARPR